MLWRRGHCAFVDTPFGFKSFEYFPNERELKVAGLECIECILPLCMISDDSGVDETTDIQLFGPEMSHDEYSRLCYLKFEVSCRI